MTPSSKTGDGKKAVTKKTTTAKVASKSGKLTTAKKEAVSKPSKSNAVEKTTSSRAKATANSDKKPATTTLSKESKPVSKSKKASGSEAKTGLKQASQPAAKSKPFARGKKTPVPKVDLVSKTVAQEVMQKLCQLYPDADCELEFKNPFELLISVILSAQTTDVQVNKCTPGLFKRFPTAKALAEGSLDEIKELIKPTGFFNAKATNIQRCAQALVERFKGEVPNTLEELTTLPGAGRKTANVVLGVAFDVPGWTVDTHVQRLTARLGFTENTDPYKIELDLQQLFPQQDWSKYSITLIWHGRRLCYAKKPDCAHCPVNNLCPSSQV